MNWPVDEGAGKGAPLELPLEQGWDSLSGGNLMPLLKVFSLHHHQFYLQELILEKYAKFMNKNSNRGVFYKIRKKKVKK